MGRTAATRGRRGAVILRAAASQWAPGAFALLLALQAGAAAAEEPRDTPAVQREQSERVEQWRREQERRAPVGAAVGVATWRLPIEDERPCVVLQRVRIVAPVGGDDDGEGAAPPSVRRLLGPQYELPGFDGACLGVRSIEVLRSNLEDRLRARGHLTSALTVPAQDLSAGELRFELEPGLVEAVVVEGADDGNRPARNALALAPGEVLDLRSLEQTVENLARLPSQSARFVIEPGSAPGTSVVRILPLAAAQPGGAARWRGYVGMDRNDSREYGLWQASAQIGVDHALGLSDQLGLWISHAQREAVEGGERPLQTTWYLSWSVPLGHHQVTLSHSRADYRRFIAAGVGLVRDAGRDDNGRARWQWTAWRGGAARLHLWTAVSQRRARTYLDDIELISRRRLATSVEQGAELWWRGPRCDVTLEAEGAQVQRLERDSDFLPPLPGLPRSWRAELTTGCRLGAGFDVALQGWVQRIAQPVDGSDLAVLGTRQTVRAHAAADARTGRGLTALRHELLGPPWRIGARAALRPGVAIDWGRVHAPLDEGRAGRELAAAALSLRWQEGRASGELVAQRPLAPPAPVSDSALRARRDARWLVSVRVLL